MNRWNGKSKAVTFSFDDGVTQDKRLIKILNDYGLKATFNLNSSLLGLGGELERNGAKISHNKNKPCDIKEIYAGHEIAVHTLTHPNLTELDAETVVWQVEEDRKALGRLCGYEVRGMAYPCGGVNNDDRVAEIIRTRTGVRYARTIKSTYDFKPQDNLYRFDPTVYFIEENELFALLEKFLSEECAEPRLFYIWGHSYELDAGFISWRRFEEFCKSVSSRADVFYGTNSEVLLSE